MGPEGNVNLWSALTGLAYCPLGKVTVSNLEKFNVFIKFELLYPNSLLSPQYS